MERGYLALYRKIQDHPFYKERRQFSKLEAWIDMLMETQHRKEPEEVSIGMDILICYYGQSLKSLRTWAARWRWSPTKVKRFFSLLEKLNQISVKNETVTTRVTILNYSKYDPKCNTSGTRPKHDRNSSETQPVTDKHDKHVKKYKLPKGNSSTKPVDATPKCPHSKIRDIYNRILGHTLPQCLSTNKTVDGFLRARWREDKQRQNLEWWEWYFGEISKSDFLMGRTDQGFTASYEWVIRPTNMSKILNGNYRNRGSGNGLNSRQADWEDLEQFQRQLREERSRG